MKKTFYLGLTFALLLPLSACGLSGGPIEGRVLDQATRNPIAGAIVVVRWKGTHLIPFADTQGSCYHAESAVTDAEGRYRTPRWSAPSKGPLFTQDYRSVTVYKAGYEQFLESRYGESEDTKKNIYLLKEFKGTREERWKYLQDITRATGCEAAGQSGRNIYPLSKAIFLEAKQIADPHTGREQLQLFREIAADYAIASDEKITPHAEYQRRINKVIQEALQ